MPALLPDVPTMRRSTDNFTLAVGVGVSSRSSPHVTTWRDYCRRC